MGESQLAGPLLNLRNELTVAPHTGQIVESPGAAQATTTWRSEDDTAAWAQRLAAQPALANAFITLHGDLGAGKPPWCATCCARWVCKAASRAPPTPWWNRTKPPGLAIWHFDFYRFDDPREWEDAGFRTSLPAPGLKLAEWPDKAAALTPPADLAIHIEAMDETERQVTLRAGTATGRSLLQGLSA